MKLANQRNPAILRTEKKEIDIMQRSRRKQDLYSMFVAK